MEAWEGASPLWATGVYMSAADVERVREREEGRAGKLLRLIPALSFFFFSTLKCCSFSGPLSWENIHVSGPAEHKELKRLKLTEGSAADFSLKLHVLIWLLKGNPSRCLFLETLFIYCMSHWCKQKQRCVIRYNECKPSVQALCWIRINWLDHYGARKAWRHHCNKSDVQWSRWKWTLLRRWRHMVKCSRFTVPVWINILPNVWDKTGCYSTCPHKVEPTCSVLFKEMFDAIWHLLYARLRFIPVLFSLVFT